MRWEHCVKRRIARGVENERERRREGEIARVASRARTVGWEYTKITGDPVTETILSLEIQIKTKRSTRASGQRFNSSATGGVM